MFQEFNDDMVKFQLPWKNRIGFPLVNTSANLGIHKSINSRVILENKNLWDAQFI